MCKYVDKKLSPKIVARSQSASLYKTKPTNTLPRVRFPSRTQKLLNKQTGTPCVLTLGMPLYAQTGKM